MVDRENKEMTSFILYIYNTLFKHVYENGFHPLVVSMPAALLNATHDYAFGYQSFLLLSQDYFFLGFLWQRPDFHFLYRQL